MRTRQLAILSCFRIHITMAPAKQMGRKEEMRRDMTREEKAAEADYQRLVEAAKQQEGRER